MEGLLRDLPKERKEPIKIHTKKGEDDRWTFTRGTTPLSEWHDLSEMEKELAEKIGTEHIDKVRIAGDALIAIPHGFACVHGKDLSTTEQGGCRVVRAGLAAYKENLVKLFEVPPDVEIDEHGFNRIFRALREIPATDYVLVIGELVKKTGKFRITLPGGKRRLGETSLEGALRELEEETKIKWEKGPATKSILLWEERALVFFFTDRTE